MKSHGGTALIGVLWVVATLGTLALGGLAAQRLGTTTTLNRLALARARWAAEGCLATALSRLDSGLATGAALAAGTRDSVLLGDGVVCTSSTADPGALLHADSATAELRDRLAYAAAAMGLSLESLLTHDGDGRVNVNQAHPAVLSVLPGFSEAAVRLVLEQRARGGLTNLEQIGNGLFASARDSLLANRDLLARIVRFTPAVVVVTTSGTSSGGPRVSIEALIWPLGRRAAVMRRRMW